VSNHQDFLKKYFSIQKELHPPGEKFAALGDL
jgi:hypothetical protein